MFTKNGAPVKWSGIFMKIKYFSGGFLDECFLNLSADNRLCYRSFHFLCIHSFNNGATWFTSVIVYVLFLWCRRSIYIKERISIHFYASVSLEKAILSKEKRLKDGSVRTCGLCMCLSSRR